MGRDYNTVAAAFTLTLTAAGVDAGAGAA